MRRALNENPVVQAVVIGVMAVAVAFLLYTRVISAGGSEDAAPAPTDTAATEAGAAPATTPAPATGAATTPAPAPATTESAATPAPAPAPGAAAGDPAAEFEPGPGLPEPVVAAYARNKVVVLLIAKRKGLDDGALALSSLRLADRSDVEFFGVPVKKVAKYARITEGVDLNRTPALVVIRPRKLTDGTPEAFVEYGYRGPESVEVAVEDALYDGKNVTYDP